MFLNLSVGLLKRFGGPNIVVRPLIAHSYILAGYRGEAKTLENVSYCWD